MSNMDLYKKKYKEAMDRMELCVRSGLKITPEYIFPELAESEDEKVRKEIIDFLKLPHPQFVGKRDHEKWIAWLEKQGEPTDKGEISDGYHTFNELYYYRMLYNAAFFNMLPKEWVHKSKKHHEGEECFGGGWFIVMANLPTGQISNHYELKDWNLFRIPEKEVADKWDGHTPQEAADRLYKYLLEKQGEKHPDPYNGISFEYNGHIWGMCARDNGVDISCDKHLIKHLEKQAEVKETAISQHENRPCEENVNSLTYEDEKVRKELIRFVKGYFPHETSEQRKAYLAWLEKQGPLKRWKPSDEQMKLLSEVQSALLGKDCHNRFTGFMWELKKLKDK